METKEIFKEIYPFSPPKIPRMCIYALFLDGNIVYISQSNVGIRRILSHAIEGEKEFDSFSCFEVYKKNAADIEAELILKNTPKYNKVLHPNNVYTSVNALRERHGIKRCPFRKILPHLELKIFMLKSRAYCKIFDFESKLKSYLSKMST